MAAFFKVEFLYPDGHVEEFDDYYRTLEAAVKFGNDLLNQVAATEQYHKHTSRDLQKAYFLVTKIEGEEHSLVYDSRKQ